MYANAFDFDLLILNLLLFSPLPPKVPGDNAGANERKGKAHHANQDASGIHYTCHSVFSQNDHFNNQVVTATGSLQVDELALSLDLHGRFAIRGCDKAAYAVGERQPRCG